jgi:hypothetical protein
MIPMNSTGPPVPISRVPGSTVSTPIVAASSATSPDVNGNRSPRPRCRAIHAAWRSMSTLERTEKVPSPFPRVCPGTQLSNPETLEWVP